MFCFVMHLIHFCLCIPQKHKVSPKKYAEGSQWETLQTTVQSDSLYFFPTYGKRRKAEPVNCLAKELLFMSIHLHCPSRLCSIKMDGKKNLIVSASSSSSLKINIGSINLKAKSMVFVSELVFVIALKRIM